MTQPGYVMSEVVPGILSAVPSRSVVLTEDDIKPKHGIGQKTFVMIDIESLGLRVGSPILSVGICSVVPGIGIIDSMKWNLNLQEQLNRGGKIEADAFFWWLNQSEAARSSLVTGQADSINLEQFQRELTDYWLTTIDARVRDHFIVDPEHMYVMALGNDFDIAQIDFWLNGAVPWHYRKKICLRALIHEYPQSVIWDENATDAKHDALEDALSQSRMLLRMIERHPHIGRIEQC